MVDNCDNRTALEYDCENHIGLVSYPSCVKCQSYNCDNCHKRITSFLTLGTNESVCTNVTMTTKKIQLPTDNEVESRNTWILNVDIDQ